MKIIYKDGHVDECPQDQELHVIRHALGRLQHTLNRAAAFSATQGSGLRFVRIIVFNRMKLC